MNKDTQREIFLDGLSWKDNFVWFCEIQDNFENKKDLLKENFTSDINNIIDDFFEFNISGLWEGINILEIKEKNIIIYLDKNDNDKLLLLNIYREYLFENFNKVLIISENRSISNTFLSTADDLFSRIQNHLEY